jgi:hypothetical protein
VARHRGLSFVTARRSWPSQGWRTAPRVEPRSVQGALVFGIINTLGASFSMVGIALCVCPAFRRHGRDRRLRGGPLVVGPLRRRHRHDGDAYGPLGDKGCHRSRGRPHVCGTATHQATPGVLDHQPRRRPSPRCRSPGRAGGSRGRPLRAGTRLRPRAALHGRGDAAQPLRNRRRAHALRIRRPHADDRGDIPHRCLGAGRVASVGCVGGKGCAGPCRRRGGRHLDRGATGRHVGVDRRRRAPEHSAGVLGSGARPAQPTRAQQRRSPETDRPIRPLPRR